MKPANSNVTRRGNLTATGDPDRKGTLNPAVISRLITNYVIHFGVGPGDDEFPSDCL